MHREFMRDDPKNHQLIADVFPAPNVLKSRLAEYSSRITQFQDNEDEELSNIVLTQPRGQVLPVPLSGKTSQSKHSPTSQAHSRSSGKRSIGSRKTQTPKSRAQAIKEETAPLPSASPHWNSDRMWWKAEEDSDRREASYHESRRFGAIGERQGGRHGPVQDTLERETDPMDPIHGFEIHPHKPENLDELFRRVAFTGNSELGPAMEAAFPVHGKNGRALRQEYTVPIRSSQEPTFAINLHRQQNFDFTSRFDDAYAEPGYKVVPAVESGEQFVGRAKQEGLDMQAGGHRQSDGASYGDGKSKLRQRNGSSGVNNSADSASSRAEVRGSGGEADVSLSGGFVDDGSWEGQASSRLKVKSIMSKIRSQEKLFGAESALKFGNEQCEVVGDGRWRILLLLADIAKRDSKTGRARNYYIEATATQPLARQGWLDYAKFEEENGEEENCFVVLEKGLNNCPGCEALLVKAVKFAEKQGKLDYARSLLSRVRGKPVDKSWKIILEGSLMEAREGNLDNARLIFSYLMSEVPWYGPIYHEAIHLEEKHRNYNFALDIVRLGLRAIPRYGPLWFSALRVLGKKYPADLRFVRGVARQAVSMISKELIWKLHFDVGRAEMQAGNYDKARQRFVQAAMIAPDHLRWKVWVGGARVETLAGNKKVARELLNRAVKEVGRKTRATVYMEYARAEEYFRNVDRARRILRHAQTECSSEWRVFLELVLLEMREGNFRGAITEAEAALRMHPGTGRLWAVLIQLKQIDGEEEQYQVFREATIRVPKSGEVWCEGARIRLNPRNNKFSLRRGQQFLRFAVRFTPQYGDSFLEYIRSELLLNHSSRSKLNVLSRLKKDCVNSEPNYGMLWMFCKQSSADGPHEVLHTARNLITVDLKVDLPYYRAGCRLYEERRTANPRKRFELQPRVGEDVKTLLEQRDRQAGPFRFNTCLNSLNVLLNNFKDANPVLRRNMILGSDILLS